VKKKKGRRQIEEVIYMGLNPDVKERRRLHLQGKRYLGSERMELWTTRMRRRHKGTGKDLR
jgi:hypothetical protein